MKKKLFVMGILCVLIFLSCVTTNESSKNTYSSANFEYKYYDSVYKTITITGIKDLKGTVVVIPSKINNHTVVKIDDYAFMKKGITEVHFPDTLKDIGVSAFRGNKLTSVTIPKNVYIWDWAFADNELSEVIFPNSVERETGILSRGIRFGVFAGNKLTKIKIPEGFDYINGEAFANNELTEIIIPTTVSRIGYKAFMNNKLTSFTIPGNITELGIDAFAGNNINSLIIPDTVKIILFENGLEGKIEGSGETRTITMTNRVLVLDDITIDAFVYGIPVTKIAKNLQSGSSVSGVMGFVDRDKNRRKIKKLVLPETLKEIEPDAFAYCDIANVVTPNKAVRDIWDEYYLKQQVADKTGDKKAFNQTVRELRRYLDDLDTKGF